MHIRGIRALAAAASLAVMAIATHASATTPLTLVSADMDRAYTAYVNVPGEGSVNAYTNGVLFQVANDGGVTSLYGFCIDVFHNMSLGALNAPNGLSYVSNQIDGGGLVVNPPQGALSADQVTKVTDLVDTGFNLFNGEHTGWYTNPLNADTEERLAAIQSAIWYTIDNSYVDPNQFSGTFKTYFDQYIGTPGLDYDNTALPGDRVFTISNGANQSFAIGWPAVPEPATWAMMLTGFFGMGSVLRRNRKLATVTA